MADDQIGPDEPEGDDAPTWEQYADPSETFSTEQLLGEIRSTSVRDAPDFLAWLGTQISMEVRTVERKLAAWHGHGSLRRAFAEQWEQIVGAAPGIALGSLTAAQVRDSPSLVRLLADSAGIAPRDAYARFADATASSRADAVLPGLAEEKVPQQAAHSYDPQGHRETHDDARSIDPQVLRAVHTGSGPATDRESRETEVVQIAGSPQPLPSGRKREILDVLKADRLRELVRGLDLHVDSYRDRDALIGALADGRRVDFRAVLARLSRDELKEMCGAGGLSAGGKEKGVLVERLLGEAAGPRDRGTSGSDEGDRSPPPKTTAAGTRSNLTASKKRDALQELKAERLRELVRELDVDARSYRDRDALIDALADGRRIDFAAILNQLSRDELKAMCSALGVAMGGKDKGVIIERILRGESSDLDDAEADTDDETATRHESAASAIVRLAGPVLSVNDVGRGWPCVGTVQLATESVSVTIYMRAIGRSGRSRPTERRFQNPANKEARIIRRPETGYALLLGLWDEQGEDRAVVVAMDAYRRMEQNTRVSLFMPLALLEEAADTGHAEHRNNSGEAIFAFRPQNLPVYIERLMLEAGLRPAQHQAVAPAEIARVAIASATVEQGEDVEGRVHIRPKVGMYAAFARLNYKPWFAIAEFVDNSIQSFLASAVLPGTEPLLIDIRIDEDEIVITDRAGGIAKSAFPRAFSPSQPPPDPSGLSEFGLGMKAAACWFARQWSVRTTALGEPIERTIEFDIPRITREGIESLPVSERVVPAEDHHTVVTLNQLLVRPRGRTLGKIKDHLESIYRVLIRKGVVRIRLSTGSATEELAHSEPKLLVAPYFREPDGTPREWRRQFEFTPGPGRRVWGWAGLLETGSVSRAGFSVFRRDRLIQGSADETYRPLELCRTPNSYTYQRLVGEIFVEGFDVSHTKDGIQWAGLEDLVVSTLKMDLNHYSLPLLQQAEGYRARRKARDLEPGFGLAAVTSTGAALTSSAVGDALAQQLDVSAPSDTASSDETVAFVRERILTKKTYTVNVPQSHLPWSVAIELISDTAADWFQRGSATKLEERSIHVLVNLAHPFSEQFVNDAEATLDPLLRVVCGLALAEETARESGVRHAGEIRIRLNKLLRGALGARARENDG